MAIGIWRYRFKINIAVSKAWFQDVLSDDEKKYLQAMIVKSRPDRETEAAIRSGDIRNFLSAGLMFATSIWAAAENAGRDFEAGAARKLAFFVYDQEAGLGKPSDAVIFVLRFKHRMST